MTSTDLKSSAQRQNASGVRPQAKPVLQYDHGNISDDGKEQLEFSITNVGSGPARIVWFDVMPKGTRYSSIGTWIIASGKSSITFASAPINRMVLAPGVQRRMVALKRPNDEAGRQRWTLIDRALQHASARLLLLSLRSVLDIEPGTRHPPRSAQLPTPGHARSGNRPRIMTGSQPSRQAGGRRMQLGGWIRDAQGHSRSGCMHSAGWRSCPVRRKRYLASS